MTYCLYFSYGAKMKNSWQVLEKVKIALVYIQSKIKATTSLL